MAGKNSAFTTRLKESIVASGLDNRGFAAKAGMGYSTLMTYLAPANNGRVPEWDQLVKIAAASGKSIDWFLTGKDSERDPAKGWRPEVKEACEKAKAIMELGDEEAKFAFLKTADFFLKDVQLRSKVEQNAREIKAQSISIKNLKKAVDKLSGKNPIENPGTHPSVSKKEAM